jgi:hypothetical protein
MDASLAAFMKTMFGWKSNTFRATKGFYHDYERLLAARRPGKGARTLLLQLLEAVRWNDLHTATVGDVNAHWRTVAKWT